MKKLVFWCLICVLVFGLAGLAFAASGGSSGGDVDVDVDVTNTQSQGIGNNNSGNASVLSPSATATGGAGGNSNVDVSIGDGLGNFSPVAISGGGDARADAEANVVNINGNTFKPVNDVDVKNYNSNELVNINGQYFCPTNRNTQDQDQKQEQQQGQQQGMANNFNWEQNINTPRPYVNPAGMATITHVYNQEFSPRDYRILTVTKDVGTFPVQAYNGEMMFAKPKIWRGNILNKINMHELYTNIFKACDSVKGKESDYRIRVLWYPKAWSFGITLGGSVASAYSPTKTAAGSVAPGIGTAGVCDVYEIYLFPVTAIGATNWKGGMASTPMVSHDSNYDVTRFNGKVVKSSIQ